MRATSVKYMVKIHTLSCIVCEPVPSLGIEALINVLLLLLGQTLYELCLLTDEFFNILAMGKLRF